MKIEFKVIKREVKTADGKTFNAYKYVAKSGRLIDLRFKKDVDTRALDAAPEKFILETEKENFQLTAPGVYEYPRAYVGGEIRVKPLETKARVIDLTSDDLPF